MCEECNTIGLTHLRRDEDEWLTAKVTIERNHYLGRFPDPRTSAEIYASTWFTGGRIGYLVFGRPEATRCGEWYGSVEDVQAGKCEVTRWQVLNLSRVWIRPLYQAGGDLCEYGVVPGYIDRRGTFRSTLASSILRSACHMIGFDYLMVRPPCFLEEPYQIKWLLSYCDTRLHRGTIYAAAGFERYRVNDQGIETWRIRLPPLSEMQDASVRVCSIVNPRSIKYRAQRAKLAMWGAEHDTD